eukprot:scaffold214298_cov16-Prasinocladus_malaysianus.AAC.2
MGSAPVASAFVSTYDQVRAHEHNSSTPKKVESDVRECTGMKWNDTSWKYKRDKPKWHGTERSEIIGPEESMERNQSKLKQSTMG